MSGVRVISHNMKVAGVVGGAALLIWFLMRGKPDATGTVGQIVVVKTSDACDPSSPNYKGADACTATGDGGSNPLAQIASSVSDAFSSVASSLGSLLTDVSPTPSGTGAGVADYVPPPDKKQEDEVSPTPTPTPRIALAPGSDGPATARLQMPGGLGARIDDRLTAHNQPSKAGHR